MAATARIQTYSTAKESKMNDRGHWKRPIESVLSLVGFCIGTGCLWRFPYLAMRNGGGAFLIPYILFTIVVGIPVLSLETAFGQYYQLSPLLIFDMCPLFKGMGISITLLSIIGFLCYMVVMAWSIYFLAFSFAYTLPWATCDNSWNSDLCVPLSNLTNITSPLTSAGFLSTEEFWRYGVLDLSEGIQDVGHIRWQLLVALIAAFVLVYVCIFKGVESSRIAVYITATVPYLLLVGLLVWLLTQTGSADGLWYFITPRWEKVTTFQTWIEAFLQVFYSLGPGWGSIISLSSFNNIHQNCLRDSIVVGFLDIITSMLCGAVVFAGVGCIAYQTNSLVEDLVATGPGLSFVTYPQVVASMPVPHLWAICFFLLLLFLGLDSQFAYVKTVSSGIIDIYPMVLKRYQPLLVLVILIISLVLSLPFITQGGFFAFHIVDWYASFFTILTVVICESVVIMWIYGGDRFISNIEDMGSFAPIWYLQFLKYCWKFLVPVSMSAALILAMVKFRSPTYGDYVYPEWTNMFGWILALSSALPIPVVMIYKLATTHGTLTQRFRKCVQPKITMGGKRKPVYAATELEECDKEEKATLEL